MIRERYVINPRPNVQIAIFRLGFTLGRLGAPRNSGILGAAFSPFATLGSKSNLPAMSGCHIIDFLILENKMDSAKSFQKQNHDDKFNDLLVNEKRAVMLKDLALNLPDVVLNDRQLCDIELLATGLFAPLNGFLCQADYESVLDRMRLQNQLLWPIPVTLDISETNIRSIKQ